MTRFAKYSLRKINYRIIHDSKGLINKNDMCAFEIQALPTVFFIKKESQIAWTGRQKARH